MFSASYFSIYIPRIKIVFLDTDYYVRQDLSYIGTVSRIDYVPIGKKQGFKEDISSHVISAFVHFNIYLNRERASKMDSNDTVESKNLFYEIQIK